LNESIGDEVIEFPIIALCGCDSGTFLCQHSMPLIINEQLIKSVFVRSFFKGVHLT
jgi:hypothetical protein